MKACLPLTALLPRITSQKQQNRTSRTLSQKKKKQLETRQSRILADLEKIPPDNQQNILEKLTNPTIDQNDKEIKPTFSELLGELDAAKLLAKTARENKQLAGKNPKDFLKTQLEAIIENQGSSQQTPASKMIINS